MFQLSPEEVREMAKIEEEANCDISAGFDWGANTVEYLRSAGSYINHPQLLSVLTEGLGRILEPQDIEAIAIELQNHTQTLVQEKVQSRKLA